MKYLSILTLVLFTALNVPSAYSQPDSGKMSKGGMQCKMGMHDKDSGACKEMMHGGMGGQCDMKGQGMMGHDGMNGQCGMMGQGGMNGMRCGMEGGMGGHDMQCGGMQGRFGMCRMIMRGIGGGLLLIVLLLLIFMQVQWSRLLSMRVRAAKLAAATPKDQTPTKVS